MTASPFSFLAGALLLAGTLAACGSSGHGSPAGAGSTVAPGVTVTSGSTNLGQVLVDAHGFTLYALSSDSASHSSCASSCAGVWPPVTVAGSAHPVAGAGLSVTLAVIMRADGTHQVVANGHPLYRYSGDSQPGQTGGEGIKSFGGTWDAVSATGAVVSGPAPSSSSSSSSGGGGYGY